MSVPPGIPTVRLRVEQLRATNQRLNEIEVKLSRSVGQAAALKWLPREVLNQPAISAVATDLERDCVGLIEQVTNGQARIRRSIELLEAVEEALRGVHTRWGKDPTVIYEQTLVALGASLGTAKSVARAEYDLFGFANGLDDIVHGVETAKRWFNGAAAVEHDFPRWWAWEVRAGATVERIMDKLPTRFLRGPNAMAKFGKALGWLGVAIEGVNVYSAFKKGDKWGMAKHGGLAAAGAFVLLGSGPAVPFVATGLALYYAWESREMIWSGLKWVGARIADVGKLQLEAAKWLGDKAISAGSWAVKHVGAAASKVGGLVTKSLPYIAGPIVNPVATGLKVAGEGLEIAGSTITSVGAAVTSVGKSIGNVGKAIWPFG